MNSMERIAAAIQFGSPDRVPVIPQIFGHAAKLMQIPLRDYCRDGGRLAECQLYAVDHYRHDAVFAVADTGVETEALGAKLEYRQDLYPFIRSYPFNTTTNLAAVKAPDPRRDGRMPEILRALRVLRREVGDEIPVVGLVLGPTTLAAQLLGLEQALYSAVDNPVEFEHLLDFCTMVQKIYGQAQLEAGAHAVLIFDPGASAEIVPPQFFRELELPRIQEMFRFFREQGNVASWLHISGQIEGILPYYEEAGANIANFDYPVDPAAVRKFLPRICVDGNLKPLAFMEEAPDVISASAKELIRAFADRGGFILSSGCEIPPAAKPDNVKALVEAAVKGKRDA